MDKLPYLKDHLQTNIPVVVSIVKRVGQYPETDFNTKQPTGRMQTLYNFQLPDGTIVRHYAKEREEDVLMHFNAGEKVQVVRQESAKADGLRIYYNVWTPTEGAEARLAANPPLHSNTQQTATQRDLKDREEEREMKDTQICLQGFMQAFIIQGLGESDALDHALSARKALLNAAREIHASQTAA